nr:hypothetical protein [Streptococcus agalactiae]
MDGFISYFPADGHLVHIYPKISKEVVSLDNILKNLLAGISSFLFASLFF